MRDERRTTGLALSPQDTAHLLDLALHMANRADEIALAGFDPGIRYELKADGSPVTRVDREVETVLRDTIEREHPKAGVIGEEYGAEAGVGRWIFDPIDGTRLYIGGDPRFAVLIAYELDGVGMVGVVSAPALGLRWWAAKGLGASYSYKGLIRAAKTSKIRRLSRAKGMLLGGFHSAGWPTAVEARRISDDLAGASVGLKIKGVSWEAVRVASAEYDLALTSGYIWDVAPLGVIVEEAGGRSSLASDDDVVFRARVNNPHLESDLAGLV